MMGLRARHSRRCSTYLDVGKWYGNAPHGQFPGSGELEVEIVGKEGEAMSDQRTKARLAVSDAQSVKPYKLEAERTLMRAHDRLEVLMT